MTIAFLFPGQSSRYSGLLSKLAAHFDEGHALVSRASERLGFDVLAHYDQPVDKAFARNVDVQLGVFLANHIWMRLMESQGIVGDLSAGLSLGEWNHLVHIGAVSFDDALAAVRARGEAYDGGPRGFMASVQPMDLDALREVVDEVQRRAEHGNVEIVNLNSPRQNVIAGDQAAVEAVMQVVEDEHFAQPVVIERQVPMHASSFAPVGARFKDVLSQIEFASPRQAYWPNRLAARLDTPTQDQFVDLLSSHVHSPVRWRETIDTIVAAHPDVVFVEVGPMKVLTNLMNRKWVKRPKFHTDTRDDLGSHLQQVVNALREVRESAATPASTEMRS